MSELYEIQANNVRLGGLENRFEGLKANYEALSKQISYTSNRAERNNLQAQLVEIDKEMDSVAPEIDRLKERNNKLAMTVRLILPEQPPSMTGQFQALIDILNPYEPAIAVNRETAYRSVCPVDWLRPMSGTLKGMLADLEDMQPDERSYPAVLKFVAYLIADAQVPEMLSQRLQQWAEQNIHQDFATVLKHVRQSLVVRLSTGNEPQPHSYLMVVIKRNNTAKQQHEPRYFIEAWFLLNGRAAVPRNAVGFEPLTIPGALEDAEKSFTVAEMEGLLKAFLDESGRKCLSQGRLLENLTIELFLPSELLNHPVDRWVMEELDDEFSMSEPLGFQHPLLLRSSERLSPNYFMRRGSSWKDKWEEVRQEIQARSPQEGISNRFVSGDGIAAKILFHQLSQPQMIGLKLAQEPLSTGRESVFAALQASATPIAVWVRQPLSCLDCITAVNELLCCGIDDIPERVKQQRRDAFPVELDCHIGHHLALLWEDFDRLPPNLDYQVA